MHYQANLYNTVKIKTFFKNQKLLYFILFTQKNQKTNIKFTQTLYKQNFKITKFKNIYLKNLFSYSILLNFTFLCSSFIFFGTNINKKLSFKNFKSLNLISIFFENSVYNKKQLKNLSSLTYKLNIKNLYFFLTRLFHSIQFK